MNIMIIGGVAAGTKAAAKIKRQDRNANVTIFTKSSDISYAGCGLPYYVGGSIENFVFPDWWFGTRSQYNGLSYEEKTSKQLYFI